MTLSWQQAIGINDDHLIEFNDDNHGSLLIHANLKAPLSALLEAAKSQSVAIKIVSSYRSFERQLTIWNNKWQGHRPVYSRHGRPLNINQMSSIEKYKAICLWSALPGLSRHHWGTDFDIFLSEPIEAGYQVNLTPDEFGKNGPCYPLQQWLDENIAHFGFYRPYKTYNHGVSEEPWHISYHNIAQPILESFNYPKWQQWIIQSNILEPQFISSQLEHYRQQYFCNLCPLE